MENYAGYRIKSAGEGVKLASKRYLYKIGNLKTTP
jgi:hypothetical protein